MTHRSKILKTKSVSWSPVCWKITRHHSFQSSVSYARFKCQLVPTVKLFNLSELPPPRKIMETKSEKGRQVIIKWWVKKYGCWEENRRSSHWDVQDVQKFKKINWLNFKRIKWPNFPNNSLKKKWTICCTGCEDGRCSQPHKRLINSKNPKQLYNSSSSAY